MSRMSDALARLEAAMVRIEQASAKAKGSGGADLQLAAELRKAQDDYAALKAKTDGVADRLDVAIGRLGGLLGDAAE
jgi:hypothetical protein